MVWEKAQKDAEVTQSQGNVWVGWQWPLLALTQAAHQKQPRTLTVASPSQLTPRYMLRVQMGPPALWCGSTIGQGWQRLGGVIGCEGQRGLGPNTPCEQSEGNNGYLHR